MAETGPRIESDPRARERREQEWSDRAARRRAGLIAGLETTPIDWESETGEVSSITELKRAGLAAAEAELRQKMARAPDLEVRASRTLFKDEE